MGAARRNTQRSQPLWVRATARLSPQLLIDLLVWSGNQFAAYMHSLDSMASGDIVSWDWPDPAPMWLVMARAFKEGHFQGHLYCKCRDERHKPALPMFTRYSVYIVVRIT
jgi:hypothetical protein